MDDSKYFVSINYIENEKKEPVILQLNRNICINDIVENEVLKNNIELSIDNKSKDIITEFDDQILAKVKSFIINMV